MAAYAIGLMQISNPSWMAEYSRTTAPLIEKHGGKYLALDMMKQLELLEGHVLPDAMVVLEFPSMEQAKAWYNDPDYAPMIELRNTGSDLQFILIEGK